MRRVKFNDMELVLVGDMNNGALTLEQDFLAGDVSFAHLMSDGRIMRYRRQIGTRADLTDLGPWEYPEGFDYFEAMGRMLDSPTWGGAFDGS